MKPAYYNEIDKYCCQWLRNLIDAGHILAGDVDERDIKDVAPDDLKGYGQLHFFAGVGGWAYAARLAGWPDDKPMWTGSCPCQPFSLAGKRKGNEDERHLWPEFARLIRECKPSIVFGEQVAGSDGRKWLNGVRLDLEEMGYAVGAADLCAASVGAPHIRQRLWWIADSDGSGWKRQGSPQSAQWDSDFVAAGNSKKISNFNCERCQVYKRSGENDEGVRNRTALRGSGKARRQGKWLPEPNILRVVDGLSKNSSAVRAYGNAIVPQVAAEIIKAMM